MIGPLSAFEQRVRAPKFNAQSLGVATSEDAVDSSASVQVPPEAKSAEVCIHSLALSQCLPKKASRSTIDSV
jgi:hypothetical protein